MLNIGTYTGTHGLKGEIKILSGFSRKDLVFKKGFKIYIKNKEYIIKSYRPHNSYDMLFLEDINDIKDIIDLRGETVYINKEDLNNVFLEEDLINGYSICTNNIKYQIKSIMYNKINTILILENNKKIPFVQDFIKDIDNKEKIVYMNLPDGLL